MATKIEKMAVNRLLQELETVQAWFDDTMYPRQSRLRFEAALAEVKAAFSERKPTLSDDPLAFDHTGQLVYTDEPDPALAEYEHIKRQWANRPEAKY